MTDVDALLADPCAAIGLPAGAIPLHCIVLVEYVDASAERPRWVSRSDEALTAWGAIGMLRFALELELTAVDDDD